MRNLTSSFTTRGGIRFVALLFCFLALVMVERAWAMDLVTYDLDSLVYMSSDIVEAQLVRNYTEHNLTLVEIKVTAVYKGAIKVDQSLAITALDFYRVPDEKMRRNSTPLPIGASCFFFLVRAKAKFLWDIPDDAVVYWTVPSGLKLVQDNKVMGFAQQMNPGPYVAQMPEDHADMTFPTLEEFRAQLPLRITQTTAWAAQPEQPATTPQLLQLLRERIQHAQRWQQDAIAEAVCRQLAYQQNPVILFEAISLNPPGNCPSILARGLGTPDGREALLQQLSNSKEPLAQRMIYARLIQQAGSIYQTKYTDKGWIVTGKLEQNNGEYLTRIARIAMQNQWQEGYCLSLLQSLDYLLNGISQSKNDALQADAQTAQIVLKSLYNTTKSEQIKFQIEINANRENRKTYDQLNAPGGAVISLVTIPDQQRYSKPTARNLAFEYHIDVLNEPIDPPSLVFLNLKTKKTYLIPTEISFQNNQGASGGKSITLPPDLPHGRYHIYLRFTSDGKVVSNGHFAETTL